LSIRRYKFRARRLVFLVLISGSSSLLRVIALRPSGSQLTHIAGMTLNGLLLSVWDSSASSYNSGRCSLLTAPFAGSHPNANASLCSLNRLGNTAGSASLVTLLSLVRQRTLCALDNRLLWRIRAKPGNISAHHDHRRISAGGSLPRFFCVCTLSQFFFAETPSDRHATV